MPVTNWGLQWAVRRNLRIRSCINLALNFDLVLACKGEERCVHLRSVESPAFNCDLTFHPFGIIVYVLSHTTLPVCSILTLY